VIIKNCFFLNLKSAHKKIIIKKKVMMLTTAVRQSRILGVVWSSLGRSTSTTVSRNVSSSSSAASDTKNKDAIKKSVFISQSNDIFTNLALEDWIYKNYDFTNHHILMLWINDPCVVIGRHQNPFSETNVSQLEAAGIELARRNSGGGTVYHDRNNLNCTFFTPRERYDRKYNLGLMTRAIYREYGIDTEISDRDDILLQGKKVSVQNLHALEMCSIFTHVPHSNRVH
jgi:lipoyltransferase 1